MVGIVVVSHSDALAAGVVAVARELGGPELALEPAGGIEEEGVLGTDAMRVRDAIDRAMSSDGVLVLMDLGSALMSAEFAIEMLEEPAGRVLMSEAPLVEGAVAAAVAARNGASLDEVAAEARGALAMKASQLGVSEGDGGSTAASDDGFVADAQATVTVRNELGIHARPAALIARAVGRFDADVRIAKGTGSPVKANSLTNVAGLSARLGDTLTVGAAGPRRGRRGRRDRGARREWVRRRSVLVGRRALGRRGRGRARAVGARSRGRGR